MDMLVLSHVGFARGHNCGGWQLILSVTHRMYVCFTQSVPTACASACRGFKD